MEYTIIHQQLLDTGFTISELEELRYKTFEYIKKVHAIHYILFSPQLKRIAIATTTENLSNKNKDTFKHLILLPKSIYTITDIENIINSIS